MMREMIADSLRSVQQAGPGIPNPGVRAVMGVGGVFLLAILFVLIYFRMKEAEEEEGIE